MLGKVVGGVLLVALGVLFSGCYDGDGEDDGYGDCCTYYEPYPIPDIPCPNGGDGECRAGSAYRCQGAYLAHDPYGCSSGTECRLVPVEGGHLQPVCSLSAEPCQSVTGTGSECQGNVRVTCEFGYPAIMKACEAPTDRCVVTDATAQDGAICAYDLPCPTALVSACDGNRAYGCDGKGIARSLRDCSALSHHCRETNGHGLCVLSEEGPRPAVFRPLEGGEYQMALTGTPRVIAQVDDFELLETEVTVAQYVACQAAGRCTPPDDACRDELRDLEPWLNGDLPATCVTFEQSAAFCEFMGARLPTDIEWEYALRNGGKDVTFPWGEATPSCEHAVLTQEGGFLWGCMRGEAWPGCSRSGDVTEHGVCDLVGNVEEWVIPVASTIAPEGLRGGTYMDFRPEVSITLGGFDGARLERGFRCARSTASP
jgi:hypothetical protein